jgi:dsDNA-specific endonuclease/ATPase MutS2
MNETILVAIIAAAGIIAAGLPAALIERARKENSEDHAKVTSTLESIEEHLTEIEDSVDDVAEALRQHTEDHV